MADKKPKIAKPKKIKVVKVETLAAPIFSLSAFVNGESHETSGETINECLAKLPVFKAIKGRAFLRVIKGNKTSEIRLIPMNARNLGRETMRIILEKRLLVNFK